MKSLIGMPPETLSSCKTVEDYVHEFNKMYSLSIPIVFDLSFLKNFESKFSSEVHKYKLPLENHERSWYLIILIYLKLVLEKYNINFYASQLISNVLAECVTDDTRDLNAFVNGIYSMLFVKDDDLDIELFPNIMYHTTELPQIESKLYTKILKERYNLLDCFKRNLKRGNVNEKKLKKFYITLDFDKLNDDEINELIFNICIVPIVKRIASSEMLISNEDDFLEILIPFLNNLVNDVDIIENISSQMADILF